jgi:hypothetical protein
MFYKDEEIVARVHETGSDLYSLTDDRELDESQDIKITHNDPTVVWYEVSEAEHITTPFDNKFGFFDTIEDAKASIDWTEAEYYKNNPREE